MASTEDVNQGDHVELEVREWLVDEKGLDSPRISGLAKVVTLNGGLLLETADRGEMWLPLSQCTVIAAGPSGGEGEDAPPGDEGDLPF